MTMTPKERQGKIAAKLAEIDRLVDSVSVVTMSLDEITSRTSEMSDTDIQKVERHREMLGGDDRLGWAAILMEAMSRGLCCDVTEHREEV